MVIITALQSGD